MAIDFKKDDVSTILNRMDSDIANLKSSMEEPSDEPLTENVNFITFLVYQAFSFRGVKREGRFDIDLNSLTEAEEERLTNLINMGYLRRVKT